MGEILDMEMSTADDISSDLDRTEKGNVKQSYENCMTVFYRDPLLSNAIKKNELTGRMDIVKCLGWKRNSSSITDTDVFQIQRYLEKNYQLTSEKIINKSLHIIASENSYHPIRDKLKTLQWDGVKRIDNLMVKYLGVDDNFYTREVIHLLMQASICRIHKPGCKFEIMVCFVGGQGAGKSTFSRFLALEDEWFSDDLKRLEDDNIYRKLQGHWFIEMSEMIATASARSIEDIKSFVSRQKETYKIPYETHPEDRLRQCVFVGTSNNMDFLPLDRTGNRRFAPILVHPEKIEKHILEDQQESREYFIQAWAEAMRIYMKSEEHTLKLSKEAEIYLTEWQKQFMPEDTKVGMIQAWLDNSQEDYVCSLMIYREAIGRENDEPKQWETREINNIMNTSIEGWQPVSSHRFGKMYGTQRGWKRKTDTKGFTEITKQMEIPFD